MTYILTRPVWANRTAVRARVNGVVHCAAGWESGIGIRTQCNRYIRTIDGTDVDYWHVIAFTNVSVGCGPLCQQCAAKVAKGK